MILNAKKVENEVVSSGSSFRPALEPASYPVRIVGIASLGKADKTNQAGEHKGTIERIGIAYQCLEEFNWTGDSSPEDPVEDEKSPVVLHEHLWMYSLEVEAATSTKRYNAIDPKDTFDGDWIKALDLPLNASAIVDKKGYNKIAGVSRMNEKAEKKAEEGVLEPWVFDFYNPDPEVYAKLPYLWKEFVIPEAKGYDKELFEKLAKGEVPPAGAVAPEDYDGV